jgi:hypothetical protein
MLNLQGSTGSKPQIKQVENWRRKPEPDTHNQNQQARIKYD